VGDRRLDLMKCEVASFFWANPIRNLFQGRNKLRDAFKSAWQSTGRKDRQHNRTNFEKEGT
jgi:hypothetical protein